MRRKALGLLGIYICHKTGEPLIGGFLWKMKKRHLMNNFLPFHELLTKYLKNQEQTPLLYTVILFVGKDQA